MAWGLLSPATPRPLILNTPPDVILRYVGRRGGGFNVRGRGLNPKLLGEGIARLPKIQFKILLGFHTVQRGAGGA